MIKAILLISDKLIDNCGIYTLIWTCAFSGDGYPYGYKKITASMQEDYALNIINYKEYSMCNKLDVLLQQRKVNPKHPRLLSKRIEVTGAYLLWQMDV